MDIAKFLEGRESRETPQELKAAVHQAISWGVPDNESIGYSQSELTQLLARLLRYCEKLEKNSIQSP